MIFAAEIKSAVSQAECARLAALADAGTILEIGAEYGRSTIAMASVAAMVWSVDWHLGDQASGFKDSLPAFIENITRHDLRSRIIAVVGRWEHVANWLDQRAFDVIFHDGCHDATAVMRDLRLAERVLRTDGVIVVHDTDQPETDEAVKVWAAASRFAAVRTVGSLMELRR